MIVMRVFVAERVPHPAHDRRRASPESECADLGIGCTGRLADKDAS
jgi:hypothetical protein